MAVITELVINILKEIGLKYISYSATNEEKTIQLRGHGLLTHNEIEKLLRIDGFAGINFGINGTHLLFEGNAIEKTQLGGK